MKILKRRWLCLLAVIVVSAGYAGIGVGGNLEPSGTPEPSMRTLEELQPSWGKKITDASKRFETVLDGAGVLDKETGLVWEKTPDTVTRQWANAIFYAYNKNVGGRKGWRLPTVEELASLVDTSVSGSPKLPVGHTFNIVPSANYWSSTTADTSFVLGVYFSAGGVTNFNKADSNSVWCVRGGQNHNGQ